MRRDIAGVRRQLGRIRRRLDRAPKRTDLIPPASRLDQRPDLAEYDIGRYSWGHLTVSYRTPGCALVVGQFCSFAYGTRVILGGEHRADFVSTYRFPAYEPFRAAFEADRRATTVTGGSVVIGNDVWIGHDALILSGATVGDGAIVGAGSVVRSTVPPYALALGNPARVAGFRFSPEQISALQRIRWWDWEESRLVEALDLMMSPDIQAFVDAYDVPE